MRTIFYLLRHASHGDVGRVLTGRLPGAPLTSFGEEEARALSVYMAGLKPSAIFSSPRLRARQTAEIVARECGLALDTAEELDEIDFGRWSGRTFEGLADDLAWKRWNEKRDTAATPAGETMRGVAQRVLRLIDALRFEYGGEAVTLVSHSDVIKAVLCHYLGKPFASVHGFEIDPASVTSLAVDDHGGVLLARNIRPMPATAGAYA